MLDHSSSLPADVSTCDPKTVHQGRFSTPLKHRSTRKMCSSSPPIYFAKRLAFETTVQAGWKVYDRESIDSSLFFDLAVCLVPSTVDEIDDAWNQLAVHAVDFCSPCCRRISLRRESDEFE